MSYKPSDKKLICIAGPTASGKSALSMELATYFECEIFSADSRQVFKEMNIGTAKPTPNELNKVKHHLISHVSIHQDYSVGHYLVDLKAALNAYFENNDIAIIVGGTGLYFRAIHEGMTNFPEISDDISARISNLYSENGISALDKLLEKYDPDYHKKVDKNNPRRLQRALEVILQSGRTYTDWIQNGNIAGLPYDMHNLYITMPRPTLYERINNRVDEMIEKGLVAEAENLYPYKDHKALSTVGYQELFPYFEGKVKLSDAINLIKQNSRRYAKRQETWFKKYGEWHCFNSSEWEQIFSWLKQHIDK